MAWFYVWPTGLIRLPGTLQDPLQAGSMLMMHAVCTCFAAGTPHALKAKCYGDKISPR